MQEEIALRLIPFFDLLPPPDQRKIMEGGAIEIVPAPGEGKALLVDIVGGCLAVATVDYRSTME